MTGSPLGNKLLWTERDPPSPSEWQYPYPVFLFLRHQHLKGCCHSARRSARGVAISLDRGHYTVVFMKDRAVACQHLQMSQCGLQSIQEARNGTAEYIRWNIPGQNYRCIVDGQASTMTQKGTGAIQLSRVSTVYRRRGRH